MLDDSKNEEEITSSTEKRQEQRYSCLGIGVLYSVKLNANLDNIGTDIYHAQVIDMSMTGISIDVHEQYQIGTPIRLCIEAPHGQREVLQAEVKGCKAIEQKKYRLGLQINSYEGVSEVCAEARMNGCYNNQLQSVPSEIRLDCPACEERVVFSYLGEQYGLPDKKQLSLYNCPACETTRSIATILQYNRKQYS